MAAQDKLFTLEDLNYGGTNFANLQPKNMFLTWWGDQLVQTDVEECYTIDVKTGKKRLLFTLDDINKWAESDDSVRYVRHLMNATFPYPDKPLVAVGNHKAYILVDFKAKQLVWQDSISDQAANDWNSVSRATAYVEDGQLCIADGQGQKHQLTTDGSSEIVYGQSVHRDEFGITKGTFWSPDGQRLAFYRMDQSMVTDYPQVDIYPRIAAYEPDKYPMAGTNTHVVTIGIYDLRTRKTTYLQTPAVNYAATALQHPCYFTNLAWSPDSKTVYLQELNRDQNDCRLVSYDAATGRRLAELYRETSPKYVEPLHPIQFLPWDNSLFIMQSQKDGYNHIYLFNIKGEQLKQLTAGPWVVHDVLGFNKNTKSVIIAANKEHPLHRRLYSVSVANGSIRQLETTDGVHRAVLSPSGKFLIDRYSTPTRPRVIDIVNTERPASNPQHLLEATDPWAGFRQPIFECGSIKAADGVTDLYYRMVKPYDFDPAKKYPTVVYVYGGPHAHNVEASWHWASRPWETYMAQKGYIVFILDNRGSENRGRDFEQATFRQLGQVEMKDQMEGVRYLKSLPYVDADRLGVHGWSYGGYMTISLMTNYPDVFKVGVAGGPVIDWKFYEVMYGERYMDTPQENPSGYENANIIPKIKNVKCPLLVMHGAQDHTVVQQHTLELLRQAVSDDIELEYFVYTVHDHNVIGPERRHLYNKLLRFHNQNTKGE